MFHYKNWHYCGWERASMDIAVGDMVESRYRARWTGTVVKLDQIGGLAHVKQEKDRHGKPFRKPKVVCYHCNLK